MHDGEASQSSDRSSVYLPIEDYALIGDLHTVSFWLVESLAIAGRIDEARLLLEKLMSYSNHVGLYAEEISLTGQALGNYPQAFTHLALVTACYYLDKALIKRKDRSSMAP